MLFDRLSACSPSAQAVIRAVILMIAACALFALLDSATKFAGLSLPVLMVLWLRFLSQASVTTALVIPAYGWRALKTRHPRLQIMRAAAGLLTTLCAFFCIQNMPLANFTAIWSVAPLCIVVISVFLFHERISLARWVLLLIGLVAAIAIARPESGQQALGWSALWPAGMLLCGTAYQVIGSRLARLDSPATTQIYSTWFPLLVTTPFIGMVWQPLPGWEIYAAAAVMGLCSGTGHLMLLHAYTHAGPAIVSPFLYTQIGFAMFMGWLFFQQTPDAISLLGIVLITLSGLAGVWLSVREKRDPIP